ncbi:hypothetical protein ACQY0O_005209 [Thecaphora frezii]
MTFTISLASLVDQSDAGNSATLNTLGTSVSFVSSLDTAQGQLNHFVPQVYLINPSGDNIFRHVDTKNAHAAIIGLIYFSMWMGALGWDIASTVFFDFRVLRETRWSSVVSSVYSVAYLLSRYVSLAWIVTAVTNSIIMTPSCDPWMKASTALFSVAISATMLVFCLRTCSIWQMRPKVVIPVVGAWLLVAAFAILLPAMSNGTHVETSQFCAWHFNGLHVVGVFASLLLFDVLCLALTVSKLNKAGWRGIARGIFPSERHNYDSEDVKTMLVQKTTAFFVIQFVFLISALLLYVTTDRYSYKLMNMVASVAAASSMAGRIFRKAWRQTRELAPERLNRPPSYYPAWADEHLDRREPILPTFASAAAASGSRPGTSGNNSSSGGGCCGGAQNKRGTRRRPGSLDFYVEGEFGVKAFSSSVISLRSTGNDRSVHQQQPSPPAATAAQAYAAQQLQVLYGADNTETSNAPSSRDRPNEATDAAGVVVEMRTRSSALLTAGLTAAGTEAGPLQSRLAERSAEGALAISKALVPALREDLNPAPGYNGRRLVAAALDDQSVSEGSRDERCGFDAREHVALAHNGRKDVRSLAARRLGTSDSSATSASVAAAGKVFAFNSFRHPAALDASATSDSEGGYLFTAPLSASSVASDGPWFRKPSIASTAPRTADSSDRSGAEAEERRKRYIASPPMSAGARLSSKEESRRVYDFDSVKAAARIEPLSGATRSTSRQPRPVRPSTTSTVEQRGTAWEGRIEAPMTPPTGSPSGDSLAQFTPRASSSIASRSIEDLRSAGHDQTSRPRTAPTWCAPDQVPQETSPSSSSSSSLPHTGPGSVEDSAVAPASTMTFDDGSEAAASTASVINGFDAGSPDGGAAGPSKVDEQQHDALFAFRQTIEEDSREITECAAVRSRSGRNRPTTGDRSKRAERSRDGDLRPRTSRGTGLNSFGRAQTADGGSGGRDCTEEADGLDEAFEDPCRPERAMSLQSQQRPLRRLKSRPDTAKSQTRPTSSRGRRTGSSAGPRSRGRLASADGVMDSRSDAARPSTAAGGDVKPFGFGILHHQTTTTAAAAVPTDSCSSGSDGDDDAADAVDLRHASGSVIERQFAKLAAEAGIPLS